MAFVDADGLVHTDDEEYVDGEDEELDEYDDEDEIDREDEEYSEEGEQDGMVEEVDGSDEELQDEAAEYIKGLRPIPGSSAAAAGSGRAPAPAWTGLQELPGATQTALFELLARLRKQGRTELTILLLGKCGVGKSSTANSIFKERVALPVVFQGDIDKPLVVSRRAQGFTLTIIDTPGLLDADHVSQAALDVITAEVQRQRVDAVLWVDRLDVFRVESLDRQAMAAVTRMLGKDIWNYTLIALTHGKLTPPTKEQSYDDFVEQRAGALRAALRQSGARGAEMPAVLVENSSRCSINEGGQAVLPTGVAWLPAFMTEVVQMASSHDQPFTVDPKAQQKADPNKRHRWLLPLLLAAQIAFKIFVLDRVLEEDGVTGDSYGPFDPDFVEEERDRLAEDKAIKKRRKELESQRRKMRSNTRSAAATDDEDDEDDIDEDSE